MALSLKALVKRFAREERGAAFVEYAMLTGIIAAVVLVVITQFGTDVATLFGNIDTNSLSKGATTTVTAK